MYCRQKAFTVSKNTLPQYTYRNTYTGYFFAEMTVRLAKDAYSQIPTVHTYLCVIYMFRRYWDWI